MSGADTFLVKETEQFRALYRWLKEAMPEGFFQLVDEETCLLIAHNLVGFRLQEYYNPINFAESSVVLCKDAPDADYKIYKHYEDRGICSLQSVISETKLPDEECYLHVAILHFTPQTVVENALVEQAGSVDVTEVQLLPSQIMPSQGTQRQWRLALACSSSPQRRFVPRLLKVLMKNELVVCGLKMTFNNPKSAERTLYLEAELLSEKPIDEEALVQELVDVRDFAADDIFEEVFGRQKEQSGLLTFLRSASVFVQQLLFHVDPHMYSMENVKEAFCYWPELADSLFQLFCLQCHPNRKNIEKFGALKRELLEIISKQDTGKEIADTRRKNVLRYGVLFVESVLKTNFFTTFRGAICYRLDSSFLKELHAIFPVSPFGIFYLYSRDFFGFHIRFQDLARGGLRTIALHTKEQAFEEAPLTFLECYELALTQHKKNKDIPEGGSKGILFLYPEQVRTPHLYRAQRLFIESLLQVANDKEWPEYLYLGPDENMHDAMIEWIADYAKKIDYKPGVAFITSKPKIGINHKRYGVTSLGVNVCMQEVLKYLNIDPKKEPFTVKMVGGPDGDVAGNQIVNLYRYFPQTAKLLTLIDISGVIYDPKGLDLAILHDLFTQEKPIRFYPPDALHEGGFLLDVKSEKREAVHIVKLLLQRKEAHKVAEEWLSGSQSQSILRSFVHKTESDIFIPAGGRPATLNEANINDFLTPQGHPTSRAIVEGANLYLTQEARNLLEQKGTIIIKDSSANKGGVICSSFEVLASLALTEEEFLRYKEEIVREILQKVELYARDEVTLILETHKKSGLACSQISEAISERINGYAAQIRDYLQHMMLKDDPYMACFYEYMLPLLHLHFHERLEASIPDGHKKAIIASWIASKVVYLRGLDWSPSIVDVLPFLIRDPTISACPLPPSH